MPKKSKHKEKIEAKGYKVHYNPLNKNKYIAIKGSDVKRAASLALLAAKFL